MGKIGLAGKPGEKVTMVSNGLLLHRRYSFHYSVILNFFNKFH